MCKSATLVLASDQECEVEENPKEETPSDSDPQAIPFADLRDPLLLQNVDSRRHASLRRHVDPQNAAHALQ